MPGIESQSSLREVTIEATVIRADGTREELGQISYWHKSRVKRLTNRLKSAFSLGDQPREQEPK